MRTLRHLCLLIGLSVSLLCLCRADKIEHAPRDADTFDSGVVVPLQQRSAGETASAHATITASVAAQDTQAQLAKLKHRWNFASLDCAAVVHRTNPTAKFASAILSEKKDRYMLSPCPSKGSTSLESSQYVIVELCEEVKIDTIVLANYEFFSSMFKRFRVTAARQLTGRPGDWTDLGSFRARNVRGQQVFRIPAAARSESFFRYIRIDFLEHFGSEYYCPVSLLRVYGLTPMEEITREFGELSPEPDTYNEVLEPLDAPPLQELPDPRSQSETVSIPEAREAGRGQNLSQGFATTDEDVWRKHEQIFQQMLYNESLASDSTDIPHIDIDDHSSTTLDSDARAATASTATSNSNGKPILPNEAMLESKGTCFPDLSRCKRVDGRLDTLSFHKGGTGSAVGSISSSEIASGYKPASIDDFERGSGAIDGQRRPPLQRGGHNPASGSESIYRAMHRRLSALEANATLSQSYIQHSGQMLREVFARMERRQEAKMSEMLHALNNSNWKEIDSLKRGQHIDLQRAIFQFNIHRQQVEAERLALLREVHLLAEEVLLEKRLSIAQLVLLLAVFIFVGMTRGSRTVPLIHSGIARISGSSKRKAAVIPALPQAATESARQDAERTLPMSLSASNLANSTGQRRPNSRMHHIDSVDRAELPSTLVVPNKLHASPHPDTFTPGKPQNEVARKSTGFSPARMQSTAKLKAPGTPVTPAVKAKSSSSRAGRLRAHPDSLLGLLTDKSLRLRLNALLHALEVLESDETARRALRQGYDRHAVGDAMAAMPSALRANSLNAAHRHRSSKFESAEQSRVQNRDPLSAPVGASQKPAAVQEVQTPLPRAHHQVSFSRQGQTDDINGMSSDWTERSETEDVSEPFALSENELASNAEFRPAISTSGPAAGESHPSAEQRMPTHPKVTELESKPVHSPRSAEMPSNFRDNGAPAQEARVALSNPLPSSEVAPQSSESESEGGVWQRVLPRRSGHGSGSRKNKARLDDPRSSIDAIDDRSALHLRRERQSSPLSWKQTKPAKPHTPDSLRRFWLRSPAPSGPEQERQRRSETPDTIRNVER
ncbi:hypothetical protein BCV70DRAFT_200180 [Testicularia cyperi]|uniref:SUN domain-containing protein n=1 Tax=Testicularia cyperi TaxID=1882483 RepID=A0A317XP03_9BASI|nr:hypothetical protein BCV70DRAFT_200180 [Testicularia cyperi]